uniref:Uncharacterized protein LOC101500112 isoform X3 n=1 Tax=Rhizophora mucronata TaxID=61149 RepID=A0A2P2MFV0_RHIMU
MSSHSLTKEFLTSSISTEYSGKSRIILSRSNYRWNLIGNDINFSLGTCKWSDFIELVIAVAMVTCIITIGACNN